MEGKEFFWKYPTCVQQATSIAGLRAFLCVNRCLHHPPLPKHGGSKSKSWSLVLCSFTNTSKLILMSFLLPILSGWIRLLEFCSPPQSINHESLVPSAWYYPGKDPEPLSRKMSQAELVWNAAHGGETILSPTSHETYRRATQLTKHQDDQLKAVLKVLDTAIITRPVRTNANLETAGCPCNISAIASSHLRLKDVDGERK